MQNIIKATLEGENGDVLKEVVLLHKNITPTFQFLSALNDALLLILEPSSSPSVPIMLPTPTAHHLSLRNSDREKRQHGKVLLQSVVHSSTIEALSNRMYTSKSYLNMDKTTPSVHEMISPSSMVLNSQQVRPIETMDINSDAILHSTKPADDNPGKDFSAILTKEIQVQPTRSGYSAHPTAMIRNSGISVLEHTTFVKSSETVLLSRAAKVPVNDTVGTPLLVIPSGKENQASSGMYLPISTSASIGIKPVPTISPTIGLSPSTSATGFSEGQISALPGSSDSVTTTSTSLNPSSVLQPKVEEDQNTKVESIGENPENVLSVHELINPSSMMLNSQQILPFETMDTNSNAIFHSTKPVDGSPKKEIQVQPTSSGYDTHTTTRVKNSGISDLQHTTFVKGSESVLLSQATTVSVIDTVGTPLLVIPSGKESQASSGMYLPFSTSASIGIKPVPTISPSTSATGSSDGQSSVLPWSSDAVTTTSTSFNPSVLQPSVEDQNTEVESTGENSTSSYPINEDLTVNATGTIEINDTIETTKGFPGMSIYDYVDDFDEDFPTDAFSTNQPSPTVGSTDDEIPSNKFNNSFTESESEIGGGPTTDNILETPTEESTINLIDELPTVDPTAVSVTIDFNGEVAVGDITISIEGPDSEDEQSNSIEYNGNSTYGFLIGSLLLVAVVVLLYVAFHYRNNVRIGIM